MINIPKGTKDILPDASYKWQHIENTARKIAALYNISEIRTPTFEHTEVFLRGVGDTTDIVNKEMYTFLDKGDRSITLKPEGTSPIARSFIENGLFNNTMPCKLFYITPCFRYERPQAGRLREFHQFGIEIFGSKEADVDVEVIMLAKQFLSKLQIKNLELSINSIGCKTCRAEYNKALKAYLADNLTSLCGQCQERYETNPLRILDCKEDSCKVVTSGAPKIIDYLCEDCKAHFEKVKSLLNMFNVEYKINPNIVRGLDYYTKTVFEFVAVGIGAQGTVCGGGRYDGLIAEMGGSDISGVGFGLGLERLILLMDSLNIPFPQNNKVKVFIASMGESEHNYAMQLAEDCRNADISAEYDHMSRSLKAQLKYADKIKAEYVVVIGSDELTLKKAKLKKMADGTEVEILLEKLTEYLG